MLIGALAVLTLTLASGPVEPRRRAPLFAARIAAGPTFGTGGTGWSVSLSLSVLAFEATVRFERAPDASLLLLSLGVHDIHRY
ncbi:MAG: hypothetical protein M3Y59_19780 [Myxococcota bacterium]|nr:hypothetical protein [Myxococcota bacterium]